MTDDQLPDLVAGAGSTLPFVGWLDDKLGDHSAMDDALYTLVRVDDPLLVLRAMATLRTWGDRIIEEAVLDARAGGCTWEQIAEALRRSRQSVHRQYAGDDDGGD